MCDVSESPFPADYDEPGRMRDTIEIYTATGCSIPYAIPEYCVPVEVGSALREDHLDGCIPDDTGDNISAYNREYCELTVLYWGWKNSDAAIKGLCHYRRFFHKSPNVHIFPNEYIHGKNLLRRSPTEQQIRQMLEHTDIILPLPYNPCPETVRTNLENYVYPKDIKAMEDVLEREYPEYYTTYCDIMRRQRLPYCNMMIARAAVYNTYCAWLFPLLEKVERAVDLTGYDSKHRRIYGYLGEVLLSVWVETQGLRAEYLNLALIWDLWSPDMKRQNLVLIGNVIHAIERIPIVNSLYYRYSASRYLEIYNSYRELTQTIAERRRQ